MNQILPDTIQITQSHIDSCRNPHGAKGCALHDAIRECIGRSYYVMVFYRSIEIWKWTAPARIEKEIEFEVHYDVEMWQLKLARDKEGVTPITLYIDERERFIDLQPLK